MDLKIRSEINPLRCVITHKPGTEHELITPNNLKKTVKISGNIKDNPNCIFGAKIYYLNNKKKIWYAGGKIKLNKGKIYHIGIGEIESGKYNANVETDYVSGCCMFANKNIFTSLNGFDSSFNMYGEDVDFCIRANALGFKSIFIYNCLVWHHVSASISSKNKILTQISSMWKLTQKHNNGLSKYSAFLNYLINSMSKLF